MLVPKQGGGVPIWSRCYYSVKESDKTGCGESHLQIRKPAATTPPAIVGTRAPPHGVLLH
jgi:hypothetical protein